MMTFSGWLRGVLWLLPVIGAGCRCDVPPVESERPGWKLVWSDEFNGRGAPDPAKWNYETGFVRNQEEQYYTDSTANARQENGCLVLEALQQELPNAGYRPEGTGWWETREKATVTSASVITDGKFDVCYGRIEMRAKLPGGRGTWPAFWMLGSNFREDNWPACGEIDIMEFVGKEGDTVYGTVHWQSDEAGNFRSKGGKAQADDLTSAFHVYALEWDPERFVFYFDDQPYFTFDIAESELHGEFAFRKPAFLMLNLAIGGSWGGEVDPAIFPARYEIDYVRVYERE